MKSVKGHLRNRLVKARKKSAGQANIWLFYSFKLDADVPIIGDLEMLYWVSELETQPQVRRFTMEHEVEISLEELGDSFEEITVTRVEHIDGSIEFHQVASKQHDSFEKVSVPVRYKIENRIEKSHLVVIPAARLKAFSKSSLSFWLKVIAFVSQVRGYDLRYEMGQVGTSISICGDGTIETLLESLSITDPALAVGAVCRSVLQGNIIVDGLRSFGRNTRWRTP
ncbi:hypothetical protein [Pseudomonas sp. Sample_20]|jgi:hypothetical protein|uniref:hypothetical protein n=1 Tax=Pseudomonas sp. Sample_20 TaxID=2448264 RepID=UPI0010328086|nr:hypothetical protein [Pseudomonas sp. Sample_20]